MLCPKFLYQNFDCFLEPKRAKIFSPDEIMIVLRKTPNDGVRHKVQIMCAYFGAMRNKEVHALKFEDFTETSDGIQCTFVRSKIKRTSIFTIPWGAWQDVCPVQLFKSYVQAVKIPSGFLFKRYLPNSLQFSQQNCGENTLKATAKYVAEFLGKTDPHTYTGHGFRRSAATALADAGKFVLLSYFYFPSFGML